MIAGAQELEIDLDEVLENCGLNVSASDLCSGRIDVIPASVYCKLYYKLNYMLQIEANRRQGIRGITPDEFRLMCNCLITAETLREVVEQQHRRVLLKAALLVQAWVPEYRRAPAKADEKNRYFHLEVTFENGSGITPGRIQGLF